MTENQMRERIKELERERKKLRVIIKAAKNYCDLLLMTLKESDSEEAEGRIHHGTSLNNGETESIEQSRAQTQENELWREGRSDLQEEQRELRRSEVYWVPKE